MPKVKVGDINKYYEVHGKGEPLVMITVGAVPGNKRKTLEIENQARNYHVH